MTRVRALVVTGLFWMCGSAAPGEEGLFPFVVSYDTPASTTNVSTRLRLGNLRDDSHRGPRIRRSRPAPHRGHGIGSEQGSPLRLSAENASLWAIVGAMHLSGVRESRRRLYSPCPRIGSQYIPSTRPATGGRPSSRPLATAGRSSPSAPHAKPSGTKWNSVETAKHTPAASRLCGCRPAGTEPQRRARFRPEIGHAADQEVPFRPHLAEPVPAGTGTRGTGDILPGPCRTKHFRGFRASAQALGGDHRHRNPSRRA